MILSKVQFLGFIVTTYYDPTYGSVYQFREFDALLGNSRNTRNHRIQRHFDALKDKVFFVEINGKQVRCANATGIAIYLYHISPNTIKTPDKIFIIRKKLKPFIKGLESGQYKFRGDHLYEMSNYPPDLVIEYKPIYC